MPRETIRFDIRGQVCPSALLLALREINRHHAALVGQELILEICTDHRDATGTIPAAARHMGFSAEVEKADGCYRILVQHPAEQGHRE